ncbi:MAG: hypothetical protein WC823_06070 [Parcubacteria group bacterium]|jgi:hypothetical protein
MSIWDMPPVGKAVEITKQSEKELDVAKEVIEKEKAEIVRRKITLARELSESRECFPFTGINPYNYQETKAVEEEYPGYFTPIDELIAKFKQEGMKVVFGKNTENGDVFILPFGSDDIENDGVLPKIFQVTDNMNEKLRELMLLGRN